MTIVPANQPMTMIFLRVTDENLHDVPDIERHPIIAWRIFECWAAPIVPSDADFQEDYVANPFRLIELPHSTKGGYHYQQVGCNGARYEYLADAIADARVEHQRWKEEAAERERVRRMLGV